MHLEYFLCGSLVVFFSEVKSISFMMIVALCSLHTDNEILAVLPVGTSNLFQAKFFDNTGKEFQATNSKLMFSLSR